MTRYYVEFCNPYEHNEKLGEYYERNDAIMALINHARDRRATIGHDPDNCDLGALWDPLLHCSRCQNYDLMSIVIDRLWQAYNNPGLHIYSTDYPDTVAVTHPTIPYLWIVHNNQHAYETL